MEQRRGKVFSRVARAIRQGVEARSMSVEDIERIARARVWSGQDALELVRRETERLSLFSDPNDVYALCDCGME